jgi:hypothetical protein
MSITTIKQRTITIELSGRKVVVRRVKWQAARAFIKKLSEHLAKVGINLSDALTQLPQLIAGAEELATDLVINSTDLKAEDFDQLDIAEAAAVLAAAVELNLGEELKNSFAGIAANLGALKPATKMSSGAEPTLS